VLREILWVGLYGVIFDDLEGREVRTSTIR